MLRRFACAVLLALGAGCSQAVADDGEAPVPVESTGELQPVAPTALCVTSGHLAALNDRTVKVDVGTMRAVVAANRSRAAEVTFTYPGPSLVDAPLANGEVRRQIGLKLRAQDACNVVYVMWHIEPTHGVFVSMKRNPGASTSTECGDSGYVNVQPSAGTPPVRVRPGDSHVLRADLAGSVLTVLADGVLAWKGNIPAEAATFDGPVGVRSDNGEFDFELKVAGGAHRSACTTGQLVSND